MLQVETRAGIRDPWGWGGATAQFPLSLILKRTGCGSMPSWIRDLCSPIIITGMHRSGTGLLARVLEVSGVFIGADRDPVNDESWSFVETNLALLGSHGFSWSDPGVPVRWDTADGWRRRFVRGYLGLRRGRCRKPRWRGQGTWAWKDPRNTFTLVFWLQQFPQARVLHIRRNGLDVALSLQKRNLQNRGMSSASYAEAMEDPCACFDLWETYCRQAQELQRALGARMLSVQFEAVIAADASEIDRLGTFLGRDVGPAVAKLADSGRTGRFDAQGLEKLRAYAERSTWMRRLGYLRRRR